MNGGEGLLRPFVLLQPESITEAVTALAGAGDETRVIGGGTSLMVLMKGGVYTPSSLISLKRIPGMNRIATMPDGGTRIGALVTQRQVESDPVVRSRYPILVEAESRVGNVRVRNMATLVGNLTHADYQSDPPPALLVLGASVEVTGPAGQRTIPLKDFFLGPYQTTLQPGEIATAVLLPPPAGGAPGAYLKYTTRSAADRPCVGVAVQLCRNGDVLGRLRVALGAVAGVPWLVEGLEEKVRQRPLTAELLAEIGHLAAAGVEPLSDLRGSAGYKKQMISVFVRRAIAQAWEKAGLCQEVS